eukprot:g9049.t1
MESAFRAFVQTKPRLILGSNSSSRKTLLSEVAKEFNFSYEVMTAGIDEKSIRREDPKDLVLVLGYEKAKAVVKRINHVPETETYVITGDQVVVHDDRILEKPESAEEIRSNIRRFSVTPASTVGSIVCTHLPSKKQLHRLDIASIYMESIPDDVIDNLIKEGTVFHSAGKNHVFAMNIFHFIQYRWIIS